MCNKIAQNNKQGIQLVNGSAHLDTPMTEFHGRGNSEDNGMSFEYDNGEPCCGSCGSGDGRIYLGAGENR
jgi:hypothetical protein